MFSQIPEKLLKDSTLTEYAATARESRWHADYKANAFNTFFKVVDFQELLQHTQSVSIPAGIVLRFCLEDFLAARGIKIIRVSDTHSESESVARRTNIEYEAKKYRSCVRNGCYYLNFNDALYTLEVDESRHSNSTTFTITSRCDAPVLPGILYQELHDYAENHNFLRGKKIDPSCTFISFERPYTWNDIVLPPALKEDIRQNLQNLLENREIYKANGLTVKRGLVFAGVPGTGKSLLGRILCHVSDWTFLWVTPKYMTRADDVAGVIDLARSLAPTILFLEDVDLFGGHRGNGSEGGVLGELMNQLDGIQENKDIITIATTNKVEIIEKALVDRPGRFDRVMTFTVPDEVGREAMLRHFMKDLILADESKISSLAKLTNGLPGAHIRELVNLAVLYALDQKSYDENKKLILRVKHFAAALKQAKKKNFDSMGFGKAASAFDDLYPFDD